MRGPRPPRLGDLIDYTAILPFVEQSRRYLGIWLGNDTCSFLFLTEDGRLRRLYSSVNVDVLAESEASETT